MTPVRKESGTNHALSQFILAKTLYSKFSRLPFCVWSLLKLIWWLLPESQSNLYSASPEKNHTERFGWYSHIGQLNATTSALSLSFAYSIHMLMIFLVLFFVFFLHVCMCVCVFCFCLCLFLFLLYFLPSTQSLCIVKQKEMQKIWIHTSLFEKKLPDTPVPFFTSSRLTIKGEVGQVVTVVPLPCPWFQQEAPLTAEKARTSLFPKQLNAL